MRLAAVILATGRRATLLVRRPASLRVTWQVEEVEVGRRQSVLLGPKGRETMGRTVVVPSAAATVIVASPTATPTAVYTPTPATADIRSACVVLLRGMAVLLDGGVVGRPALLVELPVELLALLARTVAGRLLLLDLLLALLERERCPFGLGQKLRLQESQGDRPVSLRGGKGWSEGGTSGVLLRRVDGPSMPPPFPCAASRAGR